MTETIRFALTLGCGLAIGIAIGYRIGRVVEGVRWARFDRRFARAVVHDINRRKRRIWPRSEETQTHLR